jgi:CBS domain-containing protein
MKDWKTLKAGDVMRSPLVTIELGTSCGEAADILTEREISGAPVVDAVGEILGVISLFDIANFVSGIFHGEQDGWSFYRSGHPSLREDIADTWEGDRNPLKDALVEDIMTSKVISVDEQAPLPEVVRTMAKQHIHRIFVSRGGKPYGIISTMDILHALGEEVRAPKRGRRGKAKARDLP